MKTEITVKRVFEVGDTFIRENGNALVVKGLHMTLGGQYVTFYHSTCTQLLAQHVQECLNDGRWTYLGKVEMEEEV